MHNDFNFESLGTLSKTHFVGTPCLLAVSNSFAPTHQVLLILAVLSICPPQIVKTFVPERPGTQL